MKLPPLSTLRFFDIAAKAGSFVKAAQELSVTHSAISRQIRLLEEHLGVELFERRNRAVFLTPEGQLLLQTTRGMFEQLSAVVEQIKTNATPDVVSLSCEPTIAMKWLIPRLTDFYQRHPHITVHLIAAGGAIDFAKTHVDLALRRNDFSWGGQIHAMKVCSEQMGAVSLRSGSSMMLPLLVSASRRNAWKTWQQKSGVDLTGCKYVTYEHFYLCIQAALAGQGTALASFLMVIDEIQSGQLQSSGGFIPDGSAYYLLSPKPLETHHAAATFADWLIEQINISIDCINNR